MGWLEIGPHGIDDVDVGVDRLGGQKAAEPRAAAPAQDEIDARDLGGFDPLENAGVLATVSVEVAQVPLPAVIDQEINFGATFAESFSAAGERQQLFWKRAGFSVADDQQIGVLVGKDLDALDAGIHKGSSLGLRAFDVIGGEAVVGHFLDARLLDQFEQLEAGIDALDVALAFGHAAGDGPAPVSIWDNADMFGQALFWHQWSYEGSEFHMWTAVARPPPLAICFELDRRAEKFSLVSEHILFRPSYSHPANCS